MGTPIMAALSGNYLPRIIALMGIQEAFWISVQTVLDPLNFALIIVGVLFGMILGILPGLGGTVALALLIPITFGMDPLIAFMLLTAALAGTNFGGSITSILINTPGSSPNAATLLDGYPMARDGRAGEAIGASATASALGAFFGIVILAASIPLMLSIILLFTPPEVFWLGLWGLTVIAVVVKGSVISGLISAGFGVIFALHGLNRMTANVRWNYDQVFMQDGMPLVPALIGLFAVAEMVKLVSEGGTIAKDADTEVNGSQWEGVKAVFSHRWLFVRSAFVGAVTGIIPGVGGAAANYLAYFQAVQTSSDPEEYGTGDVRGVIAPEASNDAKDGTGFLPTLGLGVPGSASMAVLLGAFVLHGITPGPILFQKNLDLVTTIIVALLIGNVLTSLIGLAFADKLRVVTQVDTRLLAPVVLSIAFFGTYALNNNIYYVFITLLFGILGFFMIKSGVSRVPMILGLVLGGIIEQNFFRSLQISSGDYGVFVRSPLAILLMLFVIGSLLLPWLRQAFQKQSIERGAT